MRPFRLHLVSRQRTIRHWRYDMATTVPGGGGVSLAVQFEGVGAGPALITFADADLAARIARMIAAGKTPRIEFKLPADFDVEAHGTSDTLSGDAWLADADDVEGHAMSVRLPSFQEALVLQKRLLIAGAIVGAIVVTRVRSEVVDRLQARLPMVHNIFF